jgi:hypothetical protein
MSAPACVCAAQPPELRMMHPTSVRGLAETLDTVSEEEDRFTTILRCRVCGQKWRMQYGGGFSADVPDLAKIS